MNFNDSSDTFARDEQNPIITGFSPMPNQL